MHNTDMENKALLFAYGELDDTQSFKKHLGACKQCQRIISDARDIQGCLPLKAAPVLDIFPSTQPKQIKRRFFRLPAFTFRGFVPTTAMLVLLTIISFTAIKINTLKTETVPEVEFALDNLEIEVAQIEKEIDDILNDLWF